MSRRARVLLVNPRVCRPQHARLPLSILALAAVLDRRHDYRMVDGNVDANPIATCLDLLARERFDLVGISVMPGPQVVQAVQIARAIRDTYAAVPILWGGYFPTLYPDAAINASYVDFLARGPGEDTLIELLERVGDAGCPTAPDSGRPSALEEIRGLTWKNNGVIVHNPERRPRPASLPPLPRLPYAALGDLAPYHNRSFLTGRTSVHEAATGCRYHCNFCGVVSMFDGKTSLEGSGPARASPDDPARSVRRSVDDVLRQQLLRQREDVSADPRGAGPRRHAVLVLRESRYPRGLFGQHLGARPPQQTAHGVHGRRVAG